MLVILHFTSNVADNSVDWKYRVESDGQIQQYEASTRGSYRPCLKLHDDDRLTLINPQPIQQDRPDVLKYYNMTALKHGIALIFNNKKFTPQDPAKHYSERLGTMRDEENTIRTCLYLGYRPVVCRDFTKDEFFHLFRNLDKFLEDCNSKAKEKVAMDSLLCFILSHGSKGVVVSSDGEDISIEDIEKLTGKSELLNSKPKIFFVQACQGDGGGTEPVQRVRADGDGKTSGRSDIYLCYATAQGDRSYRDIYTGSWFITEVCKILCEFATCDSLHSDFQLRLNENVADNVLAGTQLPPGNHGYRFYNKKKQQWFSQQPTASNQLTKHVHFFDSRKLQAFF